MIGTGDARLPLIVDDGCLYTERSRWLEQRVADTARRSGSRAARDASARARRARARPARRDAVRRAARARSSSRSSGTLAVVTGGPGTGKTLVAAAIVRGFARARHRRTIALAAQTGKAANRLTEVIGEQLARSRPGDADRALAASPPVAQTLHRLLGYRGDGFAHHAQSPLPVGALIVDEASMIDLELMDALLDALPADRAARPDRRRAPAARDRRRPDPRRPRRPRGVAARARRRARAQLPHGRRAIRAAAPCSRPPPRSTTAPRSELAERQARSRRRARPARCTFAGVEWVEPAPRATRTTPRSAVADALWHHFDGPRAQRARATHVFRFNDGAIDPAQAAELERAVAAARARAHAHRHARPADRLDRDQRAPPRARARAHDRRPAAPSSCPASR